MPGGRDAVNERRAHQFRAPAPISATTVAVVVIAALIAAGLCTWAGGTVVLHFWWRRWQRPDLLDGLPPYQPETLADEAQRWLEEQG